LKPWDPSLAEAFYRVCDGVAHGKEREIMNHTLLSVTVEPMWHIIRDIRAKIGALLSQYPAEFRFAARMTASELLENAFKYGEAVPRAPLVSLRVSLADGVFRIETANGSTDHENIARLVAFLERLSAAKNKSALYLNRIEEVLASPVENPGIGLYRIAAEGGFDLRHQYEEAVVSVIATRRVP